MHRTKSYLASVALSLLGAAGLVAEVGAIVLEVPAASATSRVTAAAPANGGGGCALDAHDGGFESAVGFQPSQSAAHIAQRFALPPPAEGAIWFLDDVCLALTRNGSAGTSAFAFAVFRDEGGLPGDVLAFRRVEAELPSFPGSTVCLGDFSYPLGGLEAIHVGLSWDPAAQNVHLMMDESPGTPAQTVSLRASASGPDGLGAWSPATAVRPAIRSAGVGIALFSSVPQWATTALAPFGEKIATEGLRSIGGGSLASLGSLAEGPATAAAGPQRLLGGVAREARYGSLVVALLVYGDPATPGAPQSWYSFVGPRDDPAAGVFTLLDLPFPSARFLGDELTPWHGDPARFVVPVVDQARNLRLLHVRLRPGAPAAETLAQRRDATPQPDNGPTGRIEGLVTDANGNPLPGATVTALHGELGLERTTTTNSTGGFLFALLPVGGYQVVVEAEGYFPQTHSFRVGVGETVPLNVQLAPGELVTEEITVTNTLVNLPTGPVGDAVQADLVAFGTALTRELTHCIALQTTDFRGTIACRDREDPANSWTPVKILEGFTVTGSNGAIGFNGIPFPGGACFAFGSPTSNTTFDVEAACTDGETAGPQTRLGSGTFVPHARRASLFDLGPGSLGDELVEAWFSEDPRWDVVGVYQGALGDYEFFCGDFSGGDLRLVPGGSSTVAGDLPAGRAAEIALDGDSLGNFLDVAHATDDGALVVQGFQRTGSCDWDPFDRILLQGASEQPRFIPLEEHREQEYRGRLSLSPFKGHRFTSSYLAWDSDRDFVPLTFLDANIPRPCAADETTHCLNDERFDLSVDWRTPDGASGPGRALPLTGDSGLFTFFDPDNVELIAKTLDACFLNDRFWAFHAGLTNVEYGLTVTDAESGRRRSYFNPLGRSARPILDTSAFATCPSTFAPRELPAWAQNALAHRDSPRVAAVNGACTPGPTALCLNGGRFRVEAEWDTGEAACEGRAIELTDDTGAFWFFAAENVEVLIKVLDACLPGFDRFWVFAAGLTNVDVRLVVTDTESGERRHYRNLPGLSFVPIQDTDAFATCP